MWVDGDDRARKLRVKAFSDRRLFSRLMEERDFRFSAPLYAYYKDRPITYLDLAHFHFVIPPSP